MNNKLVIYHNPGCSKSRQTLEIIKSKNIEPTIVLYLIDKLSKDKIKNLLLKLGLSIREILRTGEEEYKKNNLQNKNLSNEKLIEFLIKFPKLLQRPIVIKNNKAIIARPPENIFNLLK